MSGSSLSLSAKQPKSGKRTGFIFCIALPRCTFTWPQRCRYRGDQFAQVAASHLNHDLTSVWLSETKRFLRSTKARALTTFNKLEMRRRI